MSTYSISKTRKLYDMKKDPQQFTNLVRNKDSKVSEQLAEIRIQFEKRVKKFGLSLRK